MEPVIERLVLSVLLAAGVAAGLPCTGTGGEFCDSICCYTDDGFIAYCCPENKKCCGTGLCCNLGDECSMNCHTNHTECIEGSPSLISSQTSINPMYSAARRLRLQRDMEMAAALSSAVAVRDDSNCDLSDHQCCAGKCCLSCCGNICAPEGQVCCDPAPESGISPSASCPVHTPSCCLVTEPDGNSTTKCCPDGSGCCTETSCPADSVCCGSCNCCNEKTQRCRSDGTCGHVPQGVSFPLLLCAWAVAFFANFASLVHRYYEHLLLRNEQHTVCLTCQHKAHCGEPACSYKKPNKSASCIVCMAYCERQDCHGSGSMCELGYTAHEREVKDGQGDGQETVSFNILHARCPCKECLCKVCAPVFPCSCPTCQCTSCKSTHQLRSYLYSSAAGFVVFFATLLVYVLSDNSGYCLMTVLLSACWALFSSAFLAYFYTQWKGRNSPSEEVN